MRKGRALHCIAEPSFSPNRGTLFTQAAVRGSMRVGVWRSYWTYPYGGRLYKFHSRNGRNDAYDAYEASGVAAVLAHAAPSKNAVEKDVYGPGGGGKEQKE